MLYGQLDLACSAYIVCIWRILLSFPTFSLHPGSLIPSYGPGVGASVSQSKMSRSSSVPFIKNASKRAM
jgi:hypothetical protein